MNPFEVKRSLETLTLLVDTREQPTRAFRRRMETVEMPWERRKLEFGDYSALCTLPGGEEYSLAGKVAVERKMSLDELCACYGRERGRFSREFERAQEASAKLYLLVEEGSWEHAFSGKYRSRMDPRALTASMTAWLARYRCQLLFCRPETTGRLLREILYREMKERLEAMKNGPGL